MTNSKAELRREVAQFLNDTGMSKTAFGRAFFKNPNWVDRLNGPAPILDTTIARAREKMDDELGKRAETAARNSGA